MPPAPAPCRFDCVYIHPRSYDIALQAAGCAIDLTDAVLRGKVDNGFGIIRPPGHHATYEVSWVQTDRRAKFTYMLVPSEGSKTIICNTVNHFFHLIGDTPDVKKTA